MEPPPPQPQPPPEVLGVPQAPPLHSPLPEALVPRAGIHGGAPPAGPREGSQSEALQVLEAGGRTRSGVAELRAALREDLGRAREQAAALEDAFAGLAEGVQGMLAEPDPRRPAAESRAEQGRAELAALRRDLEALSGRRLEGLTEQERQQLAQLGEREQGLGERAEGVAERLEELGRQIPLLGPGLPQRARSARASMGEAGGQLGQGDPFGATPPESQALEELSEISRQLQGARQQMQQGMGQSGFQISRSRGRSGGGREVDRSPVEIPQEMEARELRAFREDVLRAMQSGRYPKEYEAEVERYYERLIR